MSSSYPHHHGEASSKDPGVGELVGQLSEQVSRLVRDELQLARLDLAAKGKKAGLGIGLFGAAGVIALYGVGVVLAAAVLALALVLDAWLAALIVAVVLFVIAAVAALVGKKEVSQGTPPLPQESIESVKRDVEALKGHRGPTGTDHTSDGTRS